MEVTSYVYIYIYNSVSNILEKSKMEIERCTKKLTEANQTWIQKQIRINYKSLY